jgi:hypothetical protein
MKLDILFQSGFGRMESVLLSNILFKLGLGVHELGFSGHHNGEFERRQLASKGFIGLSDLALYA